MNFNFNNIGTWIVIGFIILYLYLRTRSENYRTLNSSIMDLQEFATIPKQIKDLYKQEIVKEIFHPIGREISNRWVKFTPEERQQILSEMKKKLDETEQTVRESMKNKINPENVTVYVDSMSNKLMDKKVAGNVDSMDNKVPNTSTYVSGYSTKFYVD